MEHRLAIWSMAAVVFVYFLARAITFNKKIVVHVADRFCQVFDIFGRVLRIHFGCIRQHLSSPGSNLDAHCCH